MHMCTATCYRDLIVQRVLILGGSFNPVHIGHLRLAFEAKERLNADRVDFVPCFIPPHKSNTGLLPYALRSGALKAAIEGIAGFSVNEFESSSPEPSYTLYTLQNYKQTQPDTELFFLLGIGDFMQLHSWYEWQKLPEYAHITVVPRNGGQKKDFLRTANELWGDQAMPNKEAELLCLDLKHPDLPNKKTNNLCFLPLPRLDISASIIREKWRKGKSLDFLLPQNVLKYLKKHEAELNSCWQC